MLTALTPAELAVLEPLLERRSYGAGAQIMREGEPGDGCCFVDAGTVRVQLARSAEGASGQLVLGYIPAGGVVGEISLLGAVVRTASVFSETDVTVRWLTLAGFAALERAAPQVALAVSRMLLRDMSRKVQETNERLLSYVPAEATADEAAAAVRRAVTEGSPFAASWTREFLSAVPTDTEIVDALVDAGMDTFCLVADSVFASMDEYLMELAAAGRVNRWVVPSERSIPAVAVGRWLATGKLTVMSMQNSGFSHAMDYLRTVMRVHRIPGLLLSSWRGFEATLDDSEPHILVGDATDVDNRNTLGETHVFGERSGVGLRRELHRAIEDAQAGNLACLRISPPGFARTHALKAVAPSPAPTVSPAGYRRLAAAKGRPVEAVQAEAPLTRDEALRAIHARMAPRDPFYIVGNGYNPRAMQALRLTAETFENAGGMGSTLAIAWAAAKSDPSRVFVAIDGDQNAQMNEMEKVLCSDYPENLYWFILDNGTGESVGTSRSLPLAPWHYELAWVISTKNDPPGSFAYPRVNASGLKFASEEGRALAAELGNLPAQAHLARRLLARKRSQTGNPR
jgi:CRP-like cAMP-binding protein/sulfopyruvate decarboxylase TPP-binding subunit